MKSNYPKAGKKCSNLEVLDDIPNTGSIKATLDDYEILDEIREIPIKEFDFSFNANFYSSSDRKRINKLTEEIKQNKKIKPLIVVIDKEGPYVLEGSHRLVALGMLGVKTIPALVVLDKDEIKEKFMKFKKVFDRLYEDAIISRKEMQCPKCGSEDTRTFRKKQSQDPGGYRKAKLHKCKDCKAIFNDDGKVLPVHN